jgi:hypothetical protein
VRTWGSLIVSTEEVCRRCGRAVCEIYLIPSACCLQKFFTSSSLPLHSLFTLSSLPHSSPRQYPFTPLILSLTSHSLFTPSLLTPSLLTHSSLPTSVTALFSTAQAPVISAVPFLAYFFRDLAFMNPLDYRVTALVRDSKTLHQSFEDHSLILEPAKLQPRRRRKLQHRASSYQRQARITGEARLMRLETHGEKIRRFLIRQYLTIEAAKGIH